jgi:hypothetical protein
MATRRKQQQAKTKTSVGTGEKKGRNLYVLFSFFLLFYYYYYNDTIGKGGDDVLTTGSRRSVKTPEAERVCPIPRSEKRAENCETDEDRSAA